MQTIRNKITLFLQQHTHLVLWTALIFFGLNLVLGYRAIALARQIADPSLQENISRSWLQSTSLSQQVQRAEQELQQEKAVYDPLLAQIFPKEISAADATKILQQVFQTVSPAISVIDMAYQTHAIEKTSDYTRYPVQVRLLLSKDELTRLLQLLQQSGSLKQGIPVASGEKLLLPLIQLARIETTGDMSDRYDAQGNPIKTPIQADLLLQMYGK